MACTHFLFLTLIFSSAGEISGYNMDSCDADSKDTRKDDEDVTGLLQNKVRLNSLVAHLRDDPNYKTPFGWPCSVSCKYFKYLSPSLQATVKTNCKTSCAPTIAPPTMPPTTVAPTTTTTIAPPTIPPFGWTCSYYCKYFKYLSPSLQATINTKCKKSCTTAPPTMPPTTAPPTIAPPTMQPTTAPPIAPTTIAPPQVANLVKECCKVVDDYGLVPYKTWGSTPQHKRTWWDANACNTVVGGSTTPICKASPTTAPPTMPPTTAPLTMPPTTATPTMAPPPQAPKGPCLDMCVGFAKDTDWPTTCAQSMGMCDSCDGCKGLR